MLLLSVLQVSVCVLVNVLRLSVLQVSVVAESVNISGQSNTVQFKVSECRLSEDLGTLLESQRYSDVTLAVHEKEFQAHKALLAGQCH